MTRVATPQNEDYLLMIANHGTAAHVERLVRNYRKVKRGEAQARDNQHHALRELTWHIDDNGSYVMKARLGLELGVRIAQALDAAMLAIGEEQHNAAEDVSAETCLRLLRPIGVSTLRSARGRACRTGMASGWMTGWRWMGWSGGRHNQGSLRCPRLIETFAARGLLLTWGESAQRGADSCTDVKSLTDVL